MQLDIPVSLIILAKDANCDAPWHCDSVRKLVDSGRTYVDDIDTSQDSLAQATVPEKPAGTQKRNLCFDQNRLWEPAAGRYYKEETPADVQDWHYMYACLIHIHTYMYIYI